MGNEEAVRRSKRFAEKLVQEMNGRPGPWYNHPPASTTYVLCFSLEGKDYKASFPLSHLEDNKDFEAGLCKQILQAAIEQSGTGGKSETRP